MSWTIRDRMMRTIALIIVLMFMVSGCTRHTDAGFDRARLLQDAAKMSVIRLADYAPTVWDRVYIFRPYTAAGTISGEVGESVFFPHVDSEGYCFLVFLSRGQVVGASEVERNPCDFVGVVRKGGYSREEAVFNVERAGHDRWHLSRKNPAI